VPARIVDAHGAQRTSRAWTDTSFFCRLADVDEVGRGAGADRESAALRRRVLDLRREDLRLAHARAVVAGAMLMPTHPLLNLTHEVNTGADATASRAAIEATAIDRRSRFGNGGASQHEN